MRTKRTDEEIIEVCKSSSSMKQACEKLAMPFTSFSRRAKKLDVYKPTQCWSKGHTMFSDARIKGKWATDELFCKDSTYPMKRLRKIILKEKLLPYQCSCGNTGTWQEKELTLDIDHINGNHRDHRLENLRFICPNCHSQTFSFRNKNGTGKIKVTDRELTTALKETKSVRAALIKVGLSPRGLNYQRAYKLMGQSVNLDKPRHSKCLTRGSNPS
jgi:5-methylcytosine-specific restriction endonuclease McrA